MHTIVALLLSIDTYDLYTNKLYSAHFMGETILHFIYELLSYILTIQTIEETNEIGREN